MSSPQSMHIFFILQSYPTSCFHIFSTFSLPVYKRNVLKKREFKKKQHVKQKKKGRIKCLTERDEGGNIGESCEKRGQTRLDYLPLKTV